MTNKTEKQILLEVQLDWQGGTKGVLSSNDAKDVTGAIHVGTHPELGGTGEPWTAEHLLLGSIVSSFMSTFFKLARKQHVEVSHFECNIIGQVNMLEGKYKFTNINLYPKVYIIDEVLRKKINLLLLETYQSSIIINSISAHVFYHGEVLPDQHPRLSPEAETDKSLASVIRGQVRSFPY